MIGKETEKIIGYWLGESIIAREHSFHIESEVERKIKLSNNGKEKSVFLHVKSKYGM